MKKDYSFLPYFIDEDIYLVKDGLPGEPRHESQQTWATSPEPRLEFKGENRKHVVIAIDYAGEGYISPAQEALLHNILAAVNLTPEDIALVNLKKWGAPLNEAALKKIGCERLIGFGVDPKAIEGTHEKASHAIIVLNSSQYLFTYSLDELNEDREKKMVLWRHLKAMFFK